MASPAPGSAAYYISLARTLPPQLQRLFARWPHPHVSGPSAAPTRHQAKAPNPFVPWRHPETGRKHDPVYSMRRQALVVKMATQHGVDELLPWTKKLPAVRLARRIEFGLRVAGTGVGEKVKGRKFERELIPRYAVWRCGRIRWLWCGLSWCLGECANTYFPLLRMEKRREAMLKMPALIKEWKLVSRTCLTLGQLPI